MTSLYLDVAPTKVEATPPYLEVPWGNLELLKSHSIYLPLYTLLPPNTNKKKQKERKAEKTKLAQQKRD